MAEGGQDIFKARKEDCEKISWVKGVNENENIGEGVLNSQVYREGPEEVYEEEEGVCV